MKNNNARVHSEETDISQDKIIARYRARYCWQDSLFSNLNSVLACFIHSRKVPIPVAPKRILIANAGHLGDVIISSAVIPLLKNAFPTAELDFLTGSYSFDGIKDNPLLNKVILFDHWKNIRKPKPLLWKIGAFFWKLPAIVKTLVSAQYDIAIDLHSWHPNYILLFWLARIPVRVGFGRVGFESMLTHPVTFLYDRRHEIDHQLDTLRELGVNTRDLNLAQPMKPIVSNESRHRIENLIKCHFGIERYQVIHPVSSNPTRDWSIPCWIELASHLVQHGITPIITGFGERDEKIAKSVCSAVPNVISMVNKASWDELLAVLEGAEIVYSVETSIGHAARALDRPVVAIYGGMADPEHWAPIGSVIVTNKVDCSPCYIKTGCKTKDCLTRLTVEDVESAARAALKKI